MTERNKKYLGQIIRNKRKEKQITQKYLAQQTGLSRNYLSDIEHGRYMPSIDALIKIASILDLDLNLLKSIDAKEAS